MVNHHPIEMDRGNSQLSQAVFLSRKPFLITLPHSGEKVPSEAPWLQNLPETLLMFDVDRYVDQLYAPTIHRLGIPFVKTEWHRYAVDLNRLPEDVDCDSVEGHANPSGKFPRGLHWAITTTGEKLMPRPMPKATHDLLVEKYFEPFHRDVSGQLDLLRQRGAPVTYHLDAHSMPSVGTNEHRDPGERRKQIVVSDCDGKSCSPFFRDLVIQSYRSAGFDVGHNWPYKGGRLTETYGKPEKSQEAIQVELNRSLYMDEKTKRLLPQSTTDEVIAKLSQAIQQIHDALPDIA